MDFVVRTEGSMIWKPSTRQLELIATLGNARAPVDKICAALGITPEEFAWSALPPMPVAKAPEPVAPVDPRIVAERLFDDDP
jgi:hypothetical protein